MQPTVDKHLRQGWGPVNVPQSLQKAAPASGNEKKGMMKDGVRPMSATLFIVKHHGVIYRLHGLMGCAEGKDKNK